MLLSARGEGGRAHPTQEPTETVVRESVPQWTILRAAWFAQNFTEDVSLEPVRAGNLAQPSAEGREAFIDVADIADVAVAALTSDAHTGRVYELTGPEALSFRTIASLISEATGREIHYAPVGRATYLDILVQQGFPDEAAQAVTNLMESIAHGVGDRVTDDVRRVLGRPPPLFADYARKRPHQARGFLAERPVVAA